MRGETCDAVSGFAREDYNRVTISFDCFGIDPHRPNSSVMPEISRFLGIVIRMYYRDHPPAHFHAVYGDHEIEVEIETGIVIGRFPKRALRVVLEWYEEHLDELRANWQLARNEEPLQPIDPLE